MILRPPYTPFFSPYRLRSRCCSAGVGDEAARAMLKSGRGWGGGGGPRDSPLLPYLLALAGWGRIVWTSCIGWYTSFFARR